MARSLKNLFTRAFASAGSDNVGLLAAGVAYYAFLAFVPLLAAAVLSYGLFVNPETVARHMAGLTEMLPASAADLVGSQLEAVVQDSAGRKGIGLIIALAIALFGARNAAGSIVIAIGVAYECPNGRSFIRYNLLALAITVGAIVGAGLTIGALTVMTAIEDLLPQAGGAVALLGRVATYAVILAAGIGGAAVLYRYAPDRDRPGWRSVLPGAILAGCGFMLLTLLFGIYVANFGNYNATYGSLGAVIVLLTWLYLSAYVLLFGAELSAAHEDPTIGAESTA